MFQALSSLLFSSMPKRQIDGKIKLEEPQIKLEDIGIAIKLLDFPGVNSIICQYLGFAFISKMKKAGIPHIDYIKLFYNSKVGDPGLGSLEFEDIMEMQKRYNRIPESIVYRHRHHQYHTSYFLSW